MPRQGPRVTQLDKPICRERGCPKQGQPHDKCKAHKSGTIRDGNPVPCGISCMKGQFVCNRHGGKSPESVAKGRVRTSISMAMKLADFDPNDTETPEEGLLREVLWSSQIARALGEAVSQIEADEQNKGGLTQWGRDTEQLNVLIKAWQDERQLHARLCKLALDAGIAARQMELVEAQAGLVVQAMIALLTSPALGLPSETIVRGKVVAAEIMRNMSGQGRQPYRAALGGSTPVIDV